MNRDELHLWWTPLEAPADPRARREHASTVGHALVRRVLSEYADVAPEAWRFATGEHGRPRVEDGALGELDFNLAHDDALAVVGVARGTVGVDVEAIAAPAPLDVAEKFFAPSERRALAAAPAEEQPRRFFAHWVLKEAYAKALGLGLRLPLDRIAFDVADPSRIALTGDDSARWWFALIEPSPDHLAAVAWRDPPPAPRLLVRRQIW